MKQLLFFIALILFFLSSSAQQKLKFESVNGVGLLSGSSASSWQWQTINGVRYKTYFAGLGIGVDHYYFKTLPVFVDLRKAFSNAKQTPFVYLDLGLDHPLKAKEAANWWQTSEYHKGFYFDAGVGYSWKIKGALAFVISAGYSEKYLHETRTNNAIVENSLPEYYDYLLRRISTKVGLSF